MRKVIINENQRGLLFKNGRYIKMLMPGKYYTYGGKEIEVMGLKHSIISNKCDIDVVLKDKTVLGSVSVIEVGDCELALHFVNGQFAEVLERGKYAFWLQAGEHTYNKIDISSPEVSEDVPKHIFTQIPTYHYTKVEVLEYQKARLYFNQKFLKVLDSGTYYFWKNGMKIDVGFVDTRLTKMDIVGQEILTQDKVSVRINFVCNYRVTDYVKILTEIDDFTEQLHVIAQLALREYVGKYRLDEILENKEEMSKFVFAKLKERETELFVDITDAGVKDIILPGEIRDIMNTVLIAEKRAQANVITRREEVASTRSLLNTAKLMDENKTLYKLKELEYIERICENVGNINLNGNADVLTQLTGILRGNT